MSSLTSSPPSATWTVQIIHLLILNSEPDKLTKSRQRLTAFMLILDLSQSGEKTHNPTHTDRSNLSLIKDIDHIAKRICLHPPSQHWPRLITLTGLGQRQRRGREKMDEKHSKQKEMWEWKQKAEGGQKSVQICFCITYFYLHICHLC